MLALYSFSAVPKNGVNRLNPALPVWIVITTYFAILFGSALIIAFPVKVDELAHLSVIRAQFEHSPLFPDWRRYVLLREDDPARWSTEDIEPVIVKPDP